MGEGKREVEGNEEEGKKEELIGELNVNCEINSFQFSRRHLTSWILSIIFSFFLSSLSSFYRPTLPQANFLQQEGKEGKGGTEGQKGRKVIKER